MPVTVCTVEGKPGRRWGQAGKCFPCTQRPDDTWDCDQAKSKALAQGAAIRASRGDADDKRLTQAQLVVKTPGFPTSREVEYRRLLRRRVRAMTKVMRAAMDEALKGFEQDLDRGDARRSDATEAQIVASLLQVVDRVQSAFDEVVPIDLDELANQARLTDLFDANQSSDLSKRIFGVAVPPTADNDALYAEFAALQAEQIKGLEDRYFDTVREIAEDAVAKGTATTKIRNLIQEQTGVTQSHAQFIARNSIGTLNGLITEQRQTELGVTQYRWRTSRDSKVRPEHAAREGVVFDWSDPPEDGHPGIPFNCRCTPEAVLPEFNDD